MNYSLKQWDFHIIFDGILNLCISVKMDVKNQTYFLMAVYYLLFSKVTD